ncbi:GNAT family N-acetyltransferase [Marinoscillum pacificum]|uniref:GNAT family N-acetyltransferase n=1 Tax=Marinoscillum pacificum TaxID=392723 RepID=UPI00215719BF|nr:GNAT family N-acetyltransferase [Marinoscillum pacificum]
MNIEHQEVDSKGSFYVKVDGIKKAEMTYTWAGEDRIIIDHTEVHDNLRGQGVGFQMVEAAVGFAREKQISIVPLCPYARSVFKKHSELNDVL